MLEIETDKAVMEIESPGDGMLAAVSAQPGAEVPVGQTIAWLVLPGELPPVEDTPHQSGRRMTAQPETPSSAVAGQAAQRRRPQPSRRFLPKRAVWPKSMESI